MFAGAAPRPFFFFNDTAPTEIYTLCLHDALPILVTAPSVSDNAVSNMNIPTGRRLLAANLSAAQPQKKDRKSTRLNSSHGYISYAVFCLKKKNGKAGDVQKYLTAAQPVDHGLGAR